jgi:hypothetical protein
MGVVTSMARCARSDHRQRQMDATAIADYFAPLKAWLDQQNAGNKVGW